MSGGRFDYEQDKIGDIADVIERVIERNGVYHPKYPDEVIEKFKEAVNTLRRAEVYAQRVDWFLSGDDGEEAFLKRLEKDLNKLETI